MISVSVVEDDDDIRHALSLIIDGTDGFSCIGAYRDCETAVIRIAAAEPDVVLMDIALPGISGIEGIRRIKADLPEIDIIVLTVHEDDNVVFDSLCAGASGYLVKKIPPAQLLEAIKEVHEGGAPMSSKIARRVVQSFRNAPNQPLSSRELEVLNLLSLGQSYKMIAQTLYVSRHTVNAHLRNIYRKLEVHTEAQAIATAVKKKLIKV